MTINNNKELLEKTKLLIELYTEFYTKLVALIEREGGEEIIPHARLFKPLITKGTALLATLNQSTDCIPKDLKPVIVDYVISCTVLAQQMRTFVQENKEEKKPNIWDSFHQNPPTNKLIIN